MFKIILLIGLISISHSSEARLCRDVYKNHSSVSSRILVQDQISELMKTAEKYQLFGRSKRINAKEMKKLNAELEGVYKGLGERMAREPLTKDFVEKWQEFNDYWLRKIEEFEQLPKEKQQELKSSLELPLSLSVKHFIKFLEESNHQVRWDLQRLNSMLTIHLKYSELGVEACLFIFARQMQKYFSRWDFTRCKY